MLFVQLFLLARNLLVLSLDLSLERLQVFFALFRALLGLLRVFLSLHMARLECAQLLLFLCEARFERVQLFEKRRLIVAGKYLWEYFPFSFTLFSEGVTSINAYLIARRSDLGGAAETKLMIFQLRHHLLAELG